jgi:hypothetical protein
MSTGHFFPLKGEAELPDWRNCAENNVISSLLPTPNIFV